MLEAEKAYANAQAAIELMAAEELAAANVMETEDDAECQEAAKMARSNHAILMKAAAKINRLGSRQHTGPQRGHS